MDDINHMTQRTSCFGRFQNFYWKHVSVGMENFGMLRIVLQKIKLANNDVKLRRFWDCKTNGTPQGDFKNNLRLEKYIKVYLKVRLIHQNSSSKVKLNYKIISGLFFKVHLVQSLLCTSLATWTSKYFLKTPGNTSETDDYII